MALNLPARIDAVTRGLATAKTYFEVKKIYDQAKFLHRATKGVKPLRKEHNRCGLVVVDAQAIIDKKRREIGLARGAILAGRKKGSSGRKKTSLIGGHKTKPPINAPTTAELGLTKREAAEMAALAKIPEAERKRLAAEIDADGGSVSPATMLKMHRASKAEAHRSTRRKAFEDTPALRDDARDYRIGRAQDILTDIKEKQPRLILTDPPYEESADPLFDWLFRFAEDVLPVGGSLITFTGHHRLPRDFAIAAKYKLRYWWLLSLRHNEMRHLKGKYVIVGHKPVLWFVKEKRYNNEAVCDVLTSEGRDKDKHEWGQSDAGIAQLIEALTEPGDLICEPFCGNGQWGHIAVTKKRRWIGCDVVQGGSTKVIL
jgi:hypothetical protein